MFKESVGRYLLDKYRRSILGNVLAGVKDNDVATVGQINGLFPNAVEQAISDAGAATLTEYNTKWTTTGAAAGTLADGTSEGQLKRVLLVVDAGDLTLTPAKLSDGTDITFATAGDYVVLRWSVGDDAWRMIESGNTVDGVTAPVLA